jgi:hypothetical protein
MLLGKNTDVNTQGRLYGIVLQAVSYGGHEKVVQMLFTRCRCQRANGLYGNALQAASLRWHKKGVQMLLDKNADVSTLLQAASYGGYENVMKILLAAGALLQNGQQEIAPEE